MAVVVACAGPRPSPPGDPLAGRPLRSASPDELVRAVAAQAAAVRGVKGTAALGYRAHADGRQRSCRAALAARGPASGEPAGLYVKGTHSVAATLFTLVSDGERFWLHVPRDDVLYTGRVADAVAGGHEPVRLAPRDLLRALFVEPLGDDAITVAEEPEAYAVEASRDGRARRRLRLERRALAVELEAFLDDAGAEELVVERGGWREEAGTLFPAWIRLRQPAAGAEVVLEFDAVTLNPSDFGSAFQPLAPPGARVEAVPSRGVAP
jgi:hypothetical protein